MSNAEIYNSLIHPALARSFVAAGYSNERLAQELGVSVSTFYAWRSAHPEFNEAVEFGQVKAIARVEQSIYDRAIGFEYEEKVNESITRETPDGVTVENKEKTLKKCALPDVGAQRAFLAAYSPKRWGSNVTFGATVDETGNVMALPNIQITFVKPEENVSTNPAL